MKSSPVDPQDQLRVVFTTLEQARRLFTPSGLVYRVWGAAWIVGFGGTYATLAYGQDGWLGLPPSSLIGAVWMLALLIASITTYVHFARFSRERQVRSPSGLRTGLAWPAVFALLVATMLVGDFGLGLNFGALAVYTVAVVYLFMGAAFFDDVLLGTGLWIGIVNVLSLAFGVLYSLLMAILGGGGLIAAGYIHDRRFG